MPFGPGLSCFAPSPGGAGSRPLRASIPIAGAPSASRRFLGCLVARSPQGRREREHALPEVPEAGGADPCRYAPAAVPQAVRGRWCEGVSAFGPLNGPFGPARRSPGKAGRRPRTALLETPCP